MGESDLMIEDIIEQLKDSKSPAVAEICKSPSDNREIINTTISELITVAMKQNRTEVSIILSIILHI